MKNEYIVRDETGCGKNPLNGERFKTYKAAENRALECFATQFDFNIICVHGR